MKLRIMNHWNHAYPNQLAELLEKSIVIADKLNADLQSSETSQLLGDLYSREADGKLYRQRTNFLPAWQPNEKEQPAVGENKEFRGLYVFAEQRVDSWIPIYVGISRTVYRRLKQHGWYQNPSSCTLAYLRCNDQLTSGEKAELRKSSNKRDPYLHAKANAIVERERAWLRNCRVALHPVPNHYDLYFHEVAVAGRLKTEWNSFKTH